ncbi:hypothetical protein VTH82DRAFT_1352 [Thermothelomyces myriococcoides]
MSTGRYLTCDLSSPLHYINFLDPFNCECRAYGRLKQEDCEDLAIRAYGYLLLTPEQEAEVARHSSKTDMFPHVPASTQTIFDGRNFWGRYEIHRHLPVRAIVKELVRDRKPFAPSRLHDIWRDLESLHKLGILVRDIGSRNYMAGGKLIDFSQSWTMPSPCFEAIDPDDLLNQRHSDSLDLHVAIVYFGMGDGWKWGEPGYDGPTELHEYYGVPEDDDLGYYGIDPMAYDWRKWEEDPKVVDDFFQHELYAESESKDDEEEGREDLAVRAYGYLLLTPEQEAEVAERSSEIDIRPHIPANTQAELNGQNFWGRWELHRHLPVRAIVKELITNYESFAPSKLHDIWQDLESLYKLGILVRDVGPRKFMAGGKLIDFSFSWTMPSPCFDAMNPRTCWMRGITILWISMLLLSTSGWERYYGVSYSNKLGYYGIDPTAYDWHQWESDPKAADTFFKNELYAKPESEDDVEVENPPKGGEPEEEQ